MYCCFANLTAYGHCYTAQIQTNSRDPRLKAKSRVQTKREKKKEKLHSVGRPGADVGFSVHAIPSKTTPVSSREAYLGDPELLVRWTPPTRIFMGLRGQRGHDSRLSSASFPCFLTAYMQLVIYKAASQLRPYHFRSGNASWAPIYTVYMTYPRSYTIFKKPALFLACHESTTNWVWRVPLTSLCPDLASVVDRFLGSPGANFHDPQISSRTLRVTRDQRIVTHTH